MLHDLLAYGKADPGTWILVLGVEPLEHLKDTIVVCGVDAYAIVLDPNSPMVVPFLGIYEYAWWVVTPELDGIGNEVLEQLGYLGSIGHYCGKGTALDERSTVLDSSLHGLKDPLDRLVQVHRSGGALAGI